MPFGSTLYYGMLLMIMYFSFQNESEYNVLQHTQGRLGTQTATDVNYNDSEIAASE